jgi:hypothetical protein
LQVRGGGRLGDYCADLGAQFHAELDGDFVWWLGNVPEVPQSREGGIPDAAHG